jgi:hypothetical protein
MRDRTSLDLMGCSGSLFMPVKNPGTSLVSLMNGPTVKDLACMTACLKDNEIVLTLVILGQTQLEYSSMQEVM